MLKKFLWRWFYKHVGTFTHDGTRWYRAQNDLTEVIVKDHTHSLPYFQFTFTTSHRFIDLFSPILKWHWQETQQPRGYFIGNTEANIHWFNDVDLRTTLATDYDGPFCVRVLEYNEHLARDRRAKDLTSHPLPLELGLDDTIVLIGFQDSRDAVRYKLAYGGV